MIKVTRNLVGICLIVFVSNSVALGQEEYFLNLLKSKVVKNFVKRNKLKIKRNVTTEESADFVWKGKGKLTYVYIYKKRSAEEAKNDLDGFVNEVDAALNGNGTKSSLEGLGDLSILRTGYTFENDVGLDFRRDEFVGVMSGKDYQMVVELAKLIDEYLKN